MRHYVVPTFIITEAENAEDASDKVGELQTKLFAEGWSMLQDEVLSPFAFNPAVHEPHSVTDKMEIQIVE